MIEISRFQAPDSFIMSMTTNRLERCYNNSPGYDYPATTRSYNVPPIMCPVSLEHNVNIEPGSWSHSTAQQHFEGRSALLDSHDRYNIYFSITIDRQ